MTKIEQDIARMILRLDREGPLPSFAIRAAAELTPAQRRS